MICESQTPQRSRLRISITAGPRFPPALLIPTSPPRFRWEGTGMAPGLAVTFQVTEGKATALTLLQPGHILEHEDNEMMRPYFIGPGPAAP